MKQLCELRMNEVQGGGTQSEKKIQLIKLKSHEIKNWVQ